MQGGLGAGMAPILKPLGLLSVTLESVETQRKEQERTQGGGAGGSLYVQSMCNMAAYYQFRGLWAVGGVSGSSCRSVPGICMLSSPVGGGGGGAAAAAAARAASTSYSAS